MRSGSPPRQVSCRFGLRSIFASVALLAIFCLATKYAFERREYQRRLRTKFMFEQVSAGLHWWQQEYHRLPYPVRYEGGGSWPDFLDNDIVIGNDARPLYGWRFAIIQHVAGSGRIIKYDVSWDNPMHAPWKSQWQPYADDTTGITRIFAITGPGTAFGDGKTEKPRSVLEIDNDTILLAEIRNSGVHWMQAGDFDIRTMPKAINDVNGCGISSIHRTGFHVVFADGIVWYLRNDVPFGELSKFFTVAGAKSYDRNTVLKPYLWEE